MNAIRTLLASTAVMLLCAPAFAGGDHRYVVTVTNASSTFFTPLLVVAHNPQIQLFEVGTAPSEALAEIAESGSAASFLEIISTVPDLVGDAETTEGLLEPGQSVEIELEAGRSFSHLSLVAMLLPTNDSFVGVRSVPLPRSPNHDVTVAALGYDAGSEPNDELCANIPGPQCGGVGLSADAGGEGYVRVSPGISGTADLASSDYDWRNPVAFVTIRRVR